MNINSELSTLSLNPDNSVVIGSGILSALKLRENRDIDVIVTKEKYKELADNNRFKRKQNHGREILTDGLFEIGTRWIIVGKTWEFDDLLDCSTTIDGVRYNSVEFLLGAKRRWIANGEGRQKDIDDVKLMEQYFSGLKKW